MDGLPGRKMYAGVLPALCGCHEAALRHSYLSYLLDPFPTAERDAYLRMAEICHYCQRLRGNPFACCDFEKDSNPDQAHEHRWKEFATSAFTEFSHLAKDDCLSVLRCQTCGASVELPGGFAPDAFLHTCQVCGRRYRDGWPLSQLCSWECVNRLRVRKQLAYLDDLVSHAKDESLSREFRTKLHSKLKSMAEAASDETVRAKAQQLLV